MSAFVNSLLMSAKKDRLKLRPEEYLSRVDDCYSLCPRDAALPPENCRVGFTTM